MTRLKIVGGLACALGLCLADHAPSAGAGGPPEFFFEGCGTLVQGVECILFQADAGPLLVLSNLGGFGVGDHVEVSGILDPFCVTFCQQGDGCLIDNTIGPCPADQLGRCCFLGIVPEPVLCAVTTEEECFQFAAPISWTAGENCDGDPCNAPAGETFSGCGTLAIGPQGCVVIHTDSGETFALSNLGDFVPGDRVWVSRTINPDSFACFPAPIPELENNTIGECFQSCGTLAIGPQSCTLLVTDDASYALDNTGDFGIGEEVWVSGCLNPDSQACFPAQIPAIEDNTIGQCFNKCGRLVQGVTCILFKPKGGGLFVVENLGGFGVGDRVHVVGCLNPDCATVCQQGDGCVEDNTIEAFGPGVCPPGGGIPATSEASSASLEGASGQQGI